MIKIKREIKIGALIIGALFIFIWGINFLRGTDIFTKQITFYVIYEETTGLVESNAVTISGVQVGHIDKIFLHPDGSGDVVVKCTAEEKINIPDNSVARLYSASLVGTREITLKLGDSPISIETGDTLQSQIKPPIQEELSQQIIPLRDKAESILSRADTILEGISHFTKDVNRQKLTKSIEDMQKSMASIRQLTHVADTTFVANSEKLASIIHNVESLSTNLKNNNESITHILQNIESITDTVTSAEIAQTVDNANKSLDKFNRIMEKIDQGQGSIGLLVNDDSLYLNLSRSSQELELLLEDIRENPGKYINVSVFGK